MTKNLIEFLKHSRNLPGIRYFLVKTKNADFINSICNFETSLKHLKPHGQYPVSLKLGENLYKTNIKQHQSCHLPIISKLRQKNEKFKASLVQNASPYLKI